MFFLLIFRFLSRPEEILGRSEFLLCRPEFSLVRLKENPKKATFPWLSARFFVTSRANYKTPITMIGTPEIILIVLVVLLLFGGKKIPELMRGLGKGVKSFKDGMKGVDAPEDVKRDAE